MLEKFKSYIETAKQGLLWIGIPIGLLLTYIWNLKRKLDTLRQESAENKINKSLADALAKEKEAVDASKDADSEYNRIKSDYESEHKPSGN